MIGCDDGCCLYINGNCINITVKWNNNDCKSTSHYDINGNNNKYIEKADFDERAKPTTHSNDNNIKIQKEYIKLHSIVINIDNNVNYYDCNICQHQLYMNKINMK